MNKLLLSFILLIVIFSGIPIFRALLYKSKQKFLKAEKIEIDQNESINLSEAIQLKTISFDDENQFDSAAFHQFHIFLKNKYPFVDSVLEKEFINKYSVLYKWKGKNEKLAPAILLAHLDVVPEEGNWSEDPFGGIIKNNFIWGRGTLDDKVSLLGILEATEKLLRENYNPERTIYFAFGHDEEVGGKKGAASIASLLKSRGIKAEFILDEGLMVTEGIVPGMDKPIALIGIAEKGSLCVKLSADIEGGHSSMPAKENAIAIISKAIINIQEKPFTAELSEPVQKFLDYVGPEMPFYKKIIFANQWLFKKIIINVYDKTPSGNALVRTTVSPTIFKSGIKDNIIPSEASTTLNIRTIPGKPQEEIIQELKKKIDDERIKVEITYSTPPTNISSVDTHGYKIIEKTIQETFPDTYVAPTLMIAGTDSKHYGEISKNIYRFLPVRLHKEDLGRIHGADERINLEDYKNVIRFYYSLIKNIKN